MNKFETVSAAWKYYDAEIKKLTALKLESSKKRWLEIQRLTEEQRKFAEECESKKVALRAEFEKIRDEIKGGNKKAKAEEPDNEEAVLGLLTNFEC